MELDQLTKKNIRQIKDGINSLVAAGSGAPVTTTTSTATSITTSGAGTITAGSLLASVTNTGSATGSFNGASLVSGATETFPAITGRKNPAFAYDASGTTFLIITVS